jgi:hypothetical protein
MPTGIEELIMLSALITLLSKTNATMTTLHKRTTTMTGLMKSTQNKEDEDDALGPKIRHPSGCVFPNVIFLREKHDKTKLSGAARLYQDIIQFSLSREYNKLQQEEHREGFKVTDIGNWLLDNNQDYFNHNMICSSYRIY